MNTTFADGTPFRDGNPIFSAITPARGIGVRIIQLEPGETQSPIDSWIDTFGSDPHPIKELVIACVLTNQSTVDALELLKRWITNGSDLRQDTSLQQTGS